MISEMSGVLQLDAESSEAGKSLVVGGPCLKDTFYVYGLSDETIAGGRGALQKASEDVFLSLPASGPAAFSLRFGSARRGGERF